MPTWCPTIPSVPRCYWTLPTAGIELPGSQVDMVGTLDPNSLEIVTIYVYIYIHVICLNYEGSHTILLYHMIQMIHNVYVILNILTLGQVRGHCT